MTALLPHGDRAWVSWRDADPVVTHLRIFGTGGVLHAPVRRRDAPLQSPARPAAAGRVPARWSPRPLRVVRRRFARSQLRRDLREYGHTLALLACVLLGMWLADHLPFAHLIGGTP